MKALIKKMLFDGLEDRFPEFTSLLVDISGNTVILHTKDKVIPMSLDESKLITGDDGAKKLKMLADLMGITEVKDIYIEKQRNIIVMRGDKDKSVML